MGWGIVNLLKVCVCLIVYSQRYLCVVFEFPYINVVCSVTDMCVCVCMCYLVGILCVNV